MKPKIYIFSIFNWDSNLLHREHSLALAFIKLGYDVTFVERKYFGQGGFGKRMRQEDGLKVITVRSLPYFKGISKMIFQINDYFLAKQLGSIKEGNSALILSTPLWTKGVFANKTGNQKIIYDMSDDILGFATNESWRKNLGEYEGSLLAGADSVIVTSKNLLNKLPKNKKSIVVENGVDVESFKNAKPILKENYPGRLIGFIGGIFDWVDLDLVATAAVKFPDETFLLVGPTNQEAKIKTIVANHKNIEYLGPVPWKEIGNYFASLDIGLLPFVTEEKYPRLKTVSSNKIYQYAYFGYPVVTTKFSQTEGLRDTFYVSGNEEEFLQNLSLALAENDEGKRAKRQKIAGKSSWENRAKVILEQITE